jgi:PRC-barrel domain
MAEAAAMPTVGDALGWVGAPLTELGGSQIGQVERLYVDAGSGAPAWVVARVGRWRGGRLVALPMRSCAGAPFGAWAALDGDAIRSAPVVDPSRPLRREHELTICSHYGIGEAVGRAAEVAARPEGETTALPAPA